MYIDVMLRYDVSQQLLVVPFDWALLQVFPVEIVDPLRHCSTVHTASLFKSVDLLGHV